MNNSTTSIMSILLFAGLFLMFGRKAFWPKAPKFGDSKEVMHGFWGYMAKFVLNKPRYSALCCR